MSESAFNDMIATLAKCGNPIHPSTFGVGTDAVQYAGATALDLFAAHALGGMLANPAEFDKFVKTTEGAGSDDVEGFIASVAFGFAKAMLKERAIAMIQLSEEDAARAPQGGRG